MSLSNDNNVNVNVANKEINSVVLSADQKRVYGELVYFVKDPDKNEILLIGYAGTGKTTLVTKFITDIIKNKLCKRIVIAAPTHKAVNIAKSKLFDNITEDLDKNISIMTIHRLLNYQSYIDNSGHKYFAKSSNGANWEMYNLIVIDECSMLSNQIINDIREQQGGKIKIMYVGDPAQLPPVNQNDSKIFSMEIKKLYLEKIIRTSNQEIIELSNDHRKWIFSQNVDDVPHIENYLSEKIKIYSTQNKETKPWLEKFIQNIDINLNDGNVLSKNIKSSDIKILESYNSNIILTWTNKNCSLYNKYVREKIFKKTDLDKYEIGEILIFNDFHRISIPITNDLDKDLSTNSDVERISFYTSEQIKLVKIEKKLIKIDKIKNQLSSVLPDKVSEVFRKKINSINKILNTDMNIYKMVVNKISELTSNEGMIIRDYEIDTIHPLSEIEYNKMIEEFDNKMLVLKTECYNIIDGINNITNMQKCNYYTEIDKKINKIWKNWQTNIIDRFAQLTYGYAITVHKSQGSTFKNVFIDVNDILDNNDTSVMSKCIYTAITRSSNMLEILL
jgi:ATP-dependent exoDNAse (exonuclease V) alpha subunit